MIGAIWVPAKFRGELLNKITELRDNKNLTAPQLDLENDDEHPYMTQPTYYQVNEFIYPFQQVTINYGVQNYKEINPTTMGAVTFPFLFGVMFGDVFHGFLLLCFGTYLCHAESKQPPSSPSCSVAPV